MQIHQWLQVHFLRITVCTSLIYMTVLLAQDMLITNSVDTNITKYVIKEKQMMSIKAKTSGDRLCQTYEYRWENLKGLCRLHGLVNSNLESRRWE